MFVGTRPAVVVVVAGGRTIIATQVGGFNKMRWALILLPFLEVVLGVCCCWWWSWCCCCCIHLFQSKWWGSIWYLMISFITSFFYSWESLHKTILARVTIVRIWWEMMSPCEQLQHTVVVDHKLSNRAAQMFGVFCLANRGVVWRIFTGRRLGFTLPKRCGAQRIWLWGKRMVIGWCLICCSTEGYCMESCGCGEVWSVVVC